MNKEADRTLITIFPSKTDFWAQGQVPYLPFLSHIQYCTVKRLKLGHVNSFFFHMLVSWSPLIVCLSTKCFLIFMKKLRSPLNNNVRKTVSSACSNHVLCKKYLKVKLCANILIQSTTTQVVKVNPSICRLISAELGRFACYLPQTAQAF